MPDSNGHDLIAIYQTVLVGALGSICQLARRLTLTLSLMPILTRGPDGAPNAIGTIFMNTTFLLMAQYNGLVVIPAEVVCREYFSHLTVEKFVRKVSAGEIKIPLVRIERSQKCAKGVHLAASPILSMHEGSQQSANLNRFSGESLQHLTTLQRATPPKSLKVLRYLC